MAEIRHVAERHLIEDFVRRRMEAFPGARKLAAGGIEYRPARLSIDGVHLLRVPAAIVVEHEVSIDLHVCRVRGIDQRRQLSLIAEPGFGAALLIEVAEIVVIVRVIAHRGPAEIRSLVRGRQPESSKSGLLELGNFCGNEVPPRPVLLLLLRTVPVEGLKQDSHGWLLVRGWKEHSAKSAARRCRRDEKLVTGDYAFAACSSEPSGRKYCVPRIGSLTRRSSACKSSLRSTKSISEVFTISRSDDV